MMPMTMTGIMVMMLMLELHKDHAGTRIVAYAVCHRYKLLQYLVCLHTGVSATSGQSTVCTLWLYPAKWSARRGAGAGLMQQNLKIHMGPGMFLTQWLM